MSLKIVSWNIDGKPIFRTERTNHVVDVLSNYAADIVVLQEVTKPAFITLNEALNGQYLNSSYNPEGYTYQTVVWVKKTLSPSFYMQQLTSKMGKIAVHVTLANNSSFCFVGCHLEPFKTGLTTRTTQVQEILSETANVAKLIVCGDMNFIETTETFGNLLDVGPKDFTYDSERNSNVMDTYRTRLDRIFVRGIELTKVELIGTNSVEGIYPSDHFGMYAETENFLVTPS